MAFVEFWKLPAAQYNPSTHGKGIFQCSDTGDTYIFGVLNTSLSEENKSKVEKIIQGISQLGPVTHVMDENAFIIEDGQVKLNFECVDCLNSPEGKSEHKEAIPEATVSQNGLMSASDKAKISELYTKSEIDQKLTDMTAAIDYEWRGYHNMIHVSVKKDGSGDFTTIQDAINSITDASPIKQYDVQVYDDFYITDLTELYKNKGKNRNTDKNPKSAVALFFTKDWVHVRGIGKRKTLFVESPSDLEGNSFQNIQVIFPEGNCILNNFYVAIKGGRYAVHQESGGSKTSRDYHSTTRYIDMVMEHFGNSMYSNGSAWTSTYAQANGSTSGTHWIYERCTWIAHEMLPYYTHENMDFDEPCKLTFIGCRMITLKNGITILKLRDIYFGDLGSNVCSIATIIGCDFKGFNSFSYGNTRGLETERKGDDIRLGGCTISGFSNNKMLINYCYKYTLTFKTTSNNKNVKVVGGSAYDLLWGEDFKVYNGASNAPGYAIGVRKIVDFDSKWGSKSTNVYSLAARLGNCQTVPKTLIIEVDGEEHTINFNNNYMTEDGSDYTIYSSPFKKHNDIIDEINQQLSEVGVICGTVAEIEYKYFENNEEIGVNKTGITIPVGKFLVRDISKGYNAWKLATSQNSPKEIEGFSAERIDANQTGRVILTKYCYFPKNGELNKLYSIDDSSNLAITEDTTKASFKSVDISVVEFVE